MKSLEEVEQLIGSDLLMLVLGRPGGIVNSQEGVFRRYLAYLGDRVLGLALIEKLSEFVSLDNAKSLQPLVQKKSYFASRAYLREFALMLKNDFGQRALALAGSKNSMLIKHCFTAEAMEAIIAAIYLRGGYAKAKEFVAEAVMKPYFDQKDRKPVGFPFERFKFLVEEAKAQSGSLPVNDGPRVAQAYGLRANPQGNLIDCRV